MTAIHRILCPVDFSEFSLHAAGHALAIANRFGASVTGMHVLPPMRVTDPLALAPMVTAEDLEAVRLDVKRFFDSAGEGAPVESLCIEGDPAREILRRADLLHADLVVMGTHGRSGFTRLLLGSVTENVLRHASCPVLTLPPRSLDAVPLGPSLFRRILVGVDFSPCSLAGLAYAASLAQQFGARLKVVHVIDPVPEYAAIGIPGRDAWSGLELARAQLHAIVPDAVRRTTAVSEVVTLGAPAGEILAAAREEQIDLIVTGVHGRNAMDLMCFGSTTNRVVREATCPVLTIRE